MWQDIKTAPKTGEQFLAFSAGFLHDEGGPDEDWVPERIMQAEWRAHAFRSVETGNAYDFTHWQPLIAAPSSDDPPKFTQEMAERGRHMVGDTEIKRQA